MNFQWAKYCSSIPQPGPPPGEEGWVCYRIPPEVWARSGWAAAAGFRIHLPGSEPSCLYLVTRVTWEHLSWRGNQPEQRKGDLEERGEWYIFKWLLYFFSNAKFFIFYQSKVLDPTDLPHVTDTWSISYYYKMIHWCEALDAWKFRDASMWFTVRNKK